MYLCNVICGSNFRIDRMIQHVDSAVTTHATMTLAHSHTTILYIRCHNAACLTSQIVWAIHTEYLVNLLQSTNIRHPYFANFESQASYLPVITKAKWDCCYDLTIFAHEEATCEALTSNSLSANSPACPQNIFPRIVHSPWIDTNELSFTPSTNCLVTNWQVREKSSNPFRLPIRTYNYRY